MNIFRSKKFWRKKWNIIHPIKTEKGYLENRSIYYDKLEDDLRSTNFTGEIFLNIEFIPYVLVFHHVLSMFSCELDTYFNLNPYHGASSFMIIKNSTWLKKLPVREDFNKNDYTHYRLYTYDDVFDIIAASFELSFEIN